MLLWLLCLCLRSKTAKHVSSAGVVVEEELHDENDRLQMGVMQDKEMLPCENVAEDMSADTEKQITTSNDDMI